MISQPTIILFSKASINMSILRRYRSQWLIGGLGLLLSSRACLCLADMGPFSNAAIN